MNIIGRSRIWFAISLLLLIPGIISLGLWGLKPGIDFAGGQVMEIAGTSEVAEVQPLFEAQGARDIVVTTAGDNRILVRYREGEGKDSTVTAATLKAELAAKGLQQSSFESIGPAVSRDITRNAVVSVALAALAIIAFIAVAFRNAPPPVSPLSFGVTAVIALLHDTFMILGIFSILGHFYGIEIDSLFVTAVLTTIGFSIHDTIVVYDRIRENLRLKKGEFSVIVNDSIVETLDRSLSTSFTVLLTLLAVMIFGGETIRVFVLALLLGVASGTFSSIFNAAPLLVVWNRRQIKRQARKSQRRADQVKLKAKAKPVVKKTSAQK